MNNVIFLLTYYGEAGRVSEPVTVCGQEDLDARLAAAKLAGLVVSVRLADPL